MRRKFYSTNETRREWRWCLIREILLIELIITELKTSG